MLHTHTRAHLSVPLLDQNQSTDHGEWDGKIQRAELAQAATYVKMVKERFRHEPEKYNAFLEALFAYNEALFAYNENQRGEGEGEGDGGREQVKLTVVFAIPGGLAC